MPTNLNLQQMIQGLGPMLAQALQGGGQTPGYGAPPRPQPRPQFPTAPPQFPGAPPQFPTAPPQQDPLESLKSMLSPEVAARYR
jgi:hypothetical protein